MWKGSSRNASIHLRIRESQDSGTNKVLLAVGIPPSSLYRTRTPCRLVNSLSPDINHSARHPSRQGIHFADKLGLTQWPLEIDRLAGGWIPEA